MSQSLIKYFQDLCGIYPWEYKDNMIKTCRPHSSKIVNILQKRKMKTQTHVFKTQTHTHVIGIINVYFTDKYSYFSFWHTFPQMAGNHMRYTNCMLNALYQLYVRDAMLIYSLEGNWQENKQHLTSTAHFQVNNVFSIF